MKGLISGCGLFGKEESVFSIEVRTGSWSLQSGSNLACREC